MAAEVSLTQLSAHIQNPANALQLAFSSGVFKNAQTCASCGSTMTLQHYSDAPDGVCWRCPGCRKRLSVRTGSILHDSKLALPELFTFAHQWAHDRLVKDTRTEVPVASATATRLMHKLVAACQQWCKRDGRTIGGVDHIVELDETQLSRKKHDKGRAIPGSDVWIFGGIDRDTKDVFVQRVDRRNAKTLIPIIEKNVGVGTQIETDSWRSYDKLDHLGKVPQYTHESVNHRYNYVDPDTGAHTQNIERLWRDFKQKKKMQYGIRGTEIDGYCYEFTWKHWVKMNGLDPFAAVLDLISTTDWSKVDV